VEVVMTGAGAGTVITGTLIMGVLAYKAIDFVKYAWALVRLYTFDKSGGEDHESALSGAWNGLVTLLLGCGIGIGVVFLMANTTWSDEIQLGAHTLKTLPSTSLVVFGLAITSIASLLFDGKKAVDRTDTASTPKLAAKADKNRRARVAATLGPTDTTVITRLLGNLSHSRPQGDGHQEPARQAAGTTD
jgi:hypothetical protein